MLSKKMLIANIEEFQNIKELTNFTRNLNFVIIPKFYLIKTIQRKQDQFDY